MTDLYYFRDVDDNFLELESDLNFLYSELFSFRILFQEAFKQGFPASLVSHMEVILETVVGCSEDFLNSFHYLPVSDGVFKLLTEGRPGETSDFCLGENSDTVF